MEETPFEGGRGLLCVVVPVYNVEAYLPECVRSLLAQTYRPMEIVLVDDGSTDGSGKICDALQTEDARVRVIHQENRGQAAAKNRGIEAASGEYIAFVDGDDWVMPDMYERLIGAMESTGANLADCAFAYEFPDHTAHTGGDTGKVTAYPRAEALLRMGKNDPLMIESARKAYRRETIGGARFPEGTLFEEVGFLRAMQRNIGSVAYVDSPLYRYRQHRAGNTNSSFPASKLAVLAECDALTKELCEEGLFDAAEAFSAFTLDHIMRMFHNAKACHADAATLRTLRRAYRKRYQREKGNPYVRKLRGLLFRLSPDAYDRLSKYLHSRCI